MSKLQEIAKVLHRYNVGRAMKNQITEDLFRGDNWELFLAGPMDIERRLARRIVEELKLDLPKTNTEKEKK